ncbi:helix-turn-helix domain-containing protein [Sphingomonas tagetis]|uniref:helix-turn-helix domain-containing protein n=1 Tax=Sphingomonas tagetis TaxID=2949092 RepID=UPI00345E9F7C
MAFLPWTKVRLTAPKLLPYEAEPATLGEHLKKRRLTSGLLQRKVAKLLGVSHTSVLDWEAGKEPHVRMYPAIIAFLGYEPWPKPE